MDFIDVIYIRYIKYYIEPKSYTVLLALSGFDDILRAFAAVTLKSYNAILAPLIYQKRLVAVEANL